MGESMAKVKMGRELHRLLEAKITEALEAAQVAADAAFDKWTGGGAACCIPDEAAEASTRAFRAVMSYTRDTHGAEFARITTRYGIAMVAMPQITVVGYGNTTHPVCGVTVKLK